MTSTELILRLKLSLQRALLGEVTKNLYAVTAGVRGKQIKIRAYFTETASEDEAEHMDAVGTEVLADFPEDYSVEVSLLSLQDHEPEVIDFWVFMVAK